MLQITNLHAIVGDKPILKGLTPRGFVVSCEPIFFAQSHEGTKNANGVILPLHPERTM
jgi:hypothetical protein